MAKCNIQNRRSCNFLIKCVTTYHKLSTLMLQRRLSLQVIFSRCKGTCLFGTDPNKSHVNIFFKLAFLSVKMKCKITISTKIVTVFSYCSAPVFNINSVFVALGLDFHQILR